MTDVNASADSNDAAQIEALQEAVQELRNSFDSMVQGTTAANRRVAHLARQELLGRPVVGARADGTAASGVSSVASSTDTPLLALLDAVRQLDARIASRFDALERRLDDLRQQLDTRIPPA
ncbi:MAG: hypothetical protein AAF772_03930 [Acidobacteriota bacterium]